MPFDGDLRFISAIICGCPVSRIIKFLFFDFSLHIDIFFCSIILSSILLFIMNIKKNYLFPLFITCASCAVQPSPISLLPPVEESPCLFTDGSVTAPNGNIAMIERNTPQEEKVKICKFLMKDE